MQRLLLFIAMNAILLTPAFTQEKSVSATISEVTVFLQGAQINMLADAAIPAGKTVLRISKLSPQLDPNSLQVKGDGAFTIQSVNFRVNYLDSLEESREREVLLKKLESLTTEIEDMRNRSDIIVAKDVFLRENRVMGGKDSPMSPDSYRQLYELYCRFVESEKLEWFALMKKIKTAETESQKIKNQLNEQNNQRQSKSTGEVLITVSGKSPVQARFLISYLVSGAGWYPAYDIRVDRVDQPISLIYKANVYQNSGMEWKNVRLTLSNATPFQSGIIPVLSPYYLRFQPQYELQGMPVKAMAMQETMAKRSRSNKDQAGASEDMESYQPFRESAIPMQVSMSENQTNVAFIIEETYTIASDGKPQIMEIQHLEMPADYIYNGIPKLDREGFLMANIRDWEQYNLLDGAANLYFENTYVGKSSLNLRAISDTLSVSLGRDKAVVLSRTKVKDFSQKQFIGSNRIETRLWEIGIKNNKSQKVKIRLSDVVPVSTHQDITVDIQELSGGKVNKDSGIVSWELELNPKETKKLVIKYSVKYPKDQRLQID